MLDNLQFCGSALIFVLPQDLSDVVVCPRVNLIYEFYVVRYRIAEIRYHRVSSMKSRIESVLLFVPDVWSCVPTSSQWETIVQSYVQPSANESADPEAKASLTNYILFLFVFFSLHVCYLRNERESSVCSSGDIVS